MYIVSLGMKTVLMIAGIGLGTSIIEKVLEKHGYGYLNPYVNVVAWIAGGLIAIDFAQNAMHAVGRDFGVRW